jgi:hypothetical protein
MSKNDPDFLEAKLRYFVGVSLTLILGGSIFIILYSLCESSENDRALFSILTPIASFITGALGGVMAAGNNRRKNEEKEESKE